MWTSPHAVEGPSPWPAWTRTASTCSATSPWRPSGVFSSWASRSWGPPCWWPATDRRTPRSRAAWRKPARAYSSRRPRAPAASACTAARRSGTASETRPLAAASPRPTPSCCARLSRTPAPSDPAAGSTRPPWRPRRRAPRPPAAAAHRAARSRAQGRRGHDPRPAPRLVAAGGGAARRGRGARRAAAQGPRRSAAVGAITNLLARRRTAPGAQLKGHAYSLLLKDSVIYGAGRAMQKFLTALMLPLFTAFMTRSDYGVLGMVVTVTTFLDVFVTLGFDVAFTRFYFDDKDPRQHSRIITHVFFVDFFYPGVLLGVLIAFMPQISSLIMGGPGYTLYFDIGVATLFFTNLSDLPFTLMRLEHRPWTFTSFTLARVLVQVPMAVVFLAVFHLGPKGYLLANLITAILLNLAATPFYVPKLRFLWDRRLMKQMLAFAIPAMFTAISFFFLKLSDRFFLLHYQGKAEVGLYTVASALAQPLYVVGMAFRMAWPQWHYTRLNEPEKHKLLVARSSTYFMAINAILLALIGLYLPLVIHVLLARGFWSVGPTTFVLTLSVALYNLYFIFWVGANVAKKNRLIPVITLVASGVNIGLNFLLVPVYGMYAAAWTTLIGFGILVVLVYFISNRWYPVPYEWRRLIVLGVAAAVHEQQAAARRACRA